MTDALRYWESRRLLYNAVLALVTIWQLLEHGGFARPVLPAAAMLCILAALANVLYSAVYVVDIFVQVSVYQTSWRRRRWLLLLLGTLLGALLSYFVSQGTFGP